MSLFILISTGTLAGFLASTPFGPINLLIAHSVLSGKNQGFAPFLTGVILTDVFFAALAFLGWASFFSQKELTSEWEIAGGLLIIALGGYFLKRSLTKEQLKSEDNAPAAPSIQFKIRAIRDFLKGVVLCGVNPGFILFWVFVASQIQKFNISEMSYPDISLLLIGVALGNILWFWFYLTILKYGSRKFSNHIIKYIRIAISLVLIVLGIFTIVQV